MRNAKTAPRIFRVVFDVFTIAPKLDKSNPTMKQLKNLEYSLKMWNKNCSKWKYMIAFCEKKGFEFIILTDKILLRK